MISDKVRIDYVLKEFMFLLFERLSSLKLNFESTMIHSLEKRQLTIQWNESCEDGFDLSFDEYSQAYLEDAVDKMYWAIDWEIFKTRGTYYYPDTVLKTVVLPFPTWRAGVGINLVYDGFSLRLVRASDIMRDVEINRVDICFTLGRL